MVSNQNDAQPRALFLADSHFHVRRSADEDQRLHGFVALLDSHAGIEDMHPWLALSCTECHGGDGTATRKEAAHALPQVGWPKDERVMPN